MGALRSLRILVAVMVTMAAGLVASAPASAAFGDIPTSNVTGPIAVTADSYPFLATDIDLDQYGYVEQEFFLEGLAYRYDTSVAFNQNAPRYETDGPNLDGTYPFKTRIVVRRPANPADANGVVVAEWNNVTSTQDVEFNWFGDPYYLLENGYTFVGVTAQTAGVASLKAFNNARYGSLGTTADPSPGNGLPSNDPGYLPPDSDPLSFDVFSSVIKALKGGRTGVDPLGGITATKVIAREGGSAPFEPVSATHDVRAVVSTDEAAAPDSGPPPRTGDRDRDLREYARWAIRRTGYYNGTDPGYLGPRIDDVVADRTLNPDGKELDEVERELLRVVLKSEAQAINTLIAGRLELERDAMLRSVDSGAYSTFVGREEFVAHREKMQAYGERYVDWIESQMVFESDWGGETMVVFVTRANEPQFFAAQDRYAERKRVERDLIRGFFASLPR